MESRIASNTFSNNLKNRVQALDAQQYDLQQQVTTGQRIQYPSDDPSAMGHVLQLRSEKSMVSQYNRNAGQAESIINATHATLTKINSLMTRAQELAAQSSSGVNINDIGPYATETNQILEQVVSLLNSKYLGEYLFAGTKTEMGVSVYAVTRDPSSGKITAITYNGAKPTDTNYRDANFYIGESTTITPYNTGTNNLSLAAIATDLITLRSAMDTQDTATIRSQNQRIITDGNTIIGLLGNSGANLTTVEVAKAQNDERFRSNDQLISMETDIDFAQVIIALHQAQNAYQAALQTGSHVLGMSLLNYI